VVVFQSGPDVVIRGSSAFTVVFREPDVGAGRGEVECEGVEVCPGTLVGIGCVVGELTGDTVDVITVVEVTVITSVLVTSKSEVISTRSVVVTSTTEYEVVINVEVTKAVSNSVLKIVEYSVIVVNTGAIGVHPSTEKSQMKLGERII